MFKKERVFNFGDPKIYFLVVNTLRIGPFSNALLFWSIALLWLASDFGFRSRISGPRPRFPSSEYMILRSEPRILGTGLGFRDPVVGFGTRTLVFEARTSNFGFGPRISGLDLCLQVPDFGFWCPVLGFRGPNLGFRVWNWLSRSRFRILRSVSRFWSYWDVHSKIFEKIYFLKILAQIPTFSRATAV